MSDEKFNSQIMLSDNERFELLFQQMTRIMLYLKHKDPDYFHTTNELIEAHCKSVMEKLDEDYIVKMMKEVREIHL